MALTPDEAKELRDILNEIEQLSIKLRRTDIDVSGFADLEKSAGLIKTTLKSLKKDWDEVTAGVGNAATAFKSIVQDITGQNVGLKESLKSYNKLSDIGTKIRGFYKDSSTLTIKDIAKIKEKVNFEKENIKNAQELLTTEKIRSENTQKSLGKELKDIDKKINGLKAAGKQTYVEDLRRRQILATLAKEETAYNKITSAISENKALLEGENTTFQDLLLNISEAGRVLNENFVADLDKRFKNIIDEVQTTDDGVKKVTKSFDTLLGVAQKVQDHQSGANKLSEKEAKSLIDKVESERKRLANNQKLLAVEQEALKVKQEENKLELTSKSNSIKDLENQAKTRSLTEGELKTLQELKQEEALLLDTQANINSELKLNEQLQKKINTVIKGQDKNYEKLKEQLKAAKKEAENMRKALGLSGAAIDGIGKAFNKLGLGGLTSIMGLDEAKEKMADVADRITDGGKKAAGLGGQFRILVAGLKEVGASILKNLTDPVVIVTGLVAGLTASIKGLISLFEESAKYTGDIAKTFGVSADEASKIGDNLRSAAGSDFFMNNEQARAAFDAMANATGVINSNFSDQKAVSAMNDMVTYAGRSVEAYGGLLRMGKLNNMEADDMEKSLRGQLTLLQKNNKLRINENQAVEMVAKASATVRMNLGANPKKLADAAFYATKLGMTLDEISSAAEQTLNFESAIQSQLEYQLLSGKEINIDAYQQAALSGDAATASKELNRLIEEQGPAIQGNVLAQESLAKTLGISREQLMKSLELQKVQKKVGGDVAEIEKAINAEMAKGLTLEEASAKVGEKSYESIVKQNKNAAVFSNTVSQIKESFMNALSGSEGFKNLFSEENVKHYVDVIQQDVIPAVVKLAQLAGKFIGFLSKKETIETLKNGFNGLVDTIKLLKEPIKFIVENLGTISKILLAIATVKVGMNIAKGIGGIFSTIKDLTSGKFGKPGSRSNPLYVSPVGGGMGGPGMDMDGPGGPGKSMSRRQRNVNRVLKGAALGLAAYTAYNALSGKGAEDFSNEEVQSYMQQTGIQDEGQAREQMASQQYQTGSKAGDLGVAGIEAASAASINTGKSVAATSPKPLAKNQKAAYQSARSQGVPAQQAMQQARNVKPEKGMFGKAFDFMSDMGSKAVNAISDATGLTKAKDWFAKNIKSSLAPLMKSAKNTLKPLLKTLPFVGPALDLMFMGMDVNSIAKQQNMASPEELYSQIGKSVIGGGAGMLGGALAAAGVSSLQAVGIPGWLLSGTAYMGGSWLGNTIGSAISDYVGGPALGKAIMDTFYEDAPKSQAQQVQDGGLNPNGGPVVSTFQKGELVPIMQGIKEDNVYMTTNKPVQQVSDGYYGKASQDNSQVIAAINKLTEAMMANSSKEIVMQMNGQTVGKVLTPIMSNPMVRQINNTSVLV